MSNVDRLTAQHRTPFSLSPKMIALHSIGKFNKYHTLVKNHNFATTGSS